MIIVKFSYGAQYDNYNKHQEMKITFSIMNILTQAFLDLPNPCEE